MKKLFLLFILIIGTTSFAFAQKFAYINTEYILGKIPAYKTAEDQVERLAQQYQQEVETLYQKTDDLFKAYQAEKVLLTDDMRQRREDEIVTKEREAKDLQRKYFGQEGNLTSKREELIKPILDQVHSAIKAISDEGGYAIIFDTASNPSMIYTNPRYDLSDKVLEKLGYRN